MPAFLDTQPERIAPDPSGQGFLSALGIPGFDSASLNNRQYETNSFGVAALQSSIGPNFDFQVAFVSRLNTAHFAPDIIGDLALYGVASDIYRSSISNALQADGSYHLNDAHTVRLGFFGQDKNIRSDNTSTVFPLDANGNVNGGPLTRSSTTTPRTAIYSGALISRTNGSQ